jgi:adenosylcobinamide-GDP ribazoletransferase
VSGRPFGAGVRLAVTTLTVAPLRVGVVDRVAAGWAMSVAPAVGAAIGVSAAGVGALVVTAGGTAWLAAALTVTATVVLSRGLHLDGLADTADGLGSYRPAERALAIMRRPEVGPFGVVALTLTLLVQVVAAAALFARPLGSAVLAVCVAVAAGRLGIAIACRRGVPAARADGLGALVAGTVGVPALLVGAAAVAGASASAVAGRPWQGPLAVAGAVAATLAVLRHVVRRLGGVTGDVLGAVCELATTITYVVLSI